MNGIINPSNMSQLYSPAQYQLVLEIYVASLERSIAFYTSLGFDLDWRVPDIFAQVSWDGSLLFLKAKVSSTAPGNQPERPGSGNIRIMLPDVDKMCEKCRHLGYKIQQEIGDRKYVLRDFIVMDPDGFGVRFGSFLEGRGRLEQARGPNP